MAYTPNPTVVNNFKISGDYRIDALIYSDNSRWNVGSAAGTPVTLTYSFMTAVPSYGGNVSKTAKNFYTFNAAQQLATQAALSEISEASGVTFVQKTDADSVQIRFGLNDQTGSAGYAMTPPVDVSKTSTTAYKEAGDVWMNNDDSFKSSTLAPATYYRETLVHEILHALGLKHPGTYNGDDAPEPIDAYTNILGALEDNTNYTLMSYIYAPNLVKLGLGDGSVSRYNMGVYDLLALRYLYGTGNINAGDTTYTVTDTWGTYLRTIDDVSGVNTVNLSALSTGATLDLNQGAFSSVGQLTTGDRALNNVSISYGTVVQNVLGSAYADVVVGNASANNLQTGLGNDVITGAAGNDIIDGGAGLDTAVWSLASSNYELTLTSSGTGGTGGIGNTVTWQVKAKTGAEGTDTLANIERLQFADNFVALDVSGNAGTTAKILGAVFGAAAVNNKQYAGIGLHYLDNLNYTYSSLMQLALTAALGDTKNHGKVVDLLYTNVVGVAPSADDKAYYVNMLETGTQTPATLAVLAADTDLNKLKIDLVGLALHGLPYTPV
jgi:hypothetical protein